MILVPEASFKHMMSFYNFTGSIFDAEDMLLAESIDHTGSFS